MGNREESRALAEKTAGEDWDRLTGEDYHQGGFTFRREYPDKDAYVEEWLEERYLHEATVLLERRRLVKKFNAQLRGAPNRQRAIKRACHAVFGYEWPSE